MTVATAPPTAAADIPERRPQVDHRLTIARRLRRDIGASLEYLWELSGSVRLARVDAVLVEGAEAATGQRLRVFYLGHYDNYAFILGRLFSDFEIVEKWERRHSLEARRWISRLTGDVSLLVLDLELLYCRLLPRAGTLSVPQWLRQKYLVPEGWQGVLDAMHKNTKRTDLRKIRKYGLSYRLTRDEEDYRRFYHDMYKPYLRERFADEVIIEPESKVMRQCRKGELMHILREDRVVAAVLLHQLAGRLAYVWVGVPEGLSEEMQRGAFSAMYYYTLLHGYRQGCREIDFLGSRPLLNDGLFRYKRKWGTYVTDSPVPRGDILLRPLRWDTPVRSFFARNRFIVRKGTDLVGKILLEDHPLDAEGVAEIVKQNETPGVCELQIYTSAGLTNGAARALSETAGLRHVDLSRAADPVAAFCSSP